MKNLLTRTSTDRAIERQETASSSRLLEWSIIGGVVVLTLALREVLFSTESPDYLEFISPWYDFIQSHGGFAALKYNFSNYNVAYLYFLAMATYIPLPKLVTIKSISVFFDILLALFTYLTVEIRYKKSYTPIIAAMIVLFAPTVFINSAVWGQCDSIYTSFSLGGLYFLLRKQTIWAFVFFGLAISFKLQAIFLFPLLFVLLITKEIRIRHFFIIPVVYLMTILPTYLIGRDFVNLLTIYRSQADKYPSLTLNAPTIFQWIPVPQFEPWKNTGIALTLSAVVILSFVVLTSRRKMSNEVMLKLALLFVLIVPFLLPSMHDRYFYLADVISILYAFYFKKYFYVPILIQISSLLSYIPFLRYETVIDLKYLSLLMLGVITIVTLDLVKNLYSTYEIRPERDVTAKDDAMMEKALQLELLN